MSFFDLGELDNVLTSLDLVPSASFFEDGKSEKARCRSWCPNVEMLFMRQQFLRAVSIIGDQGQSSQRLVCTLAFVTGIAKSSVVQFLRCALPTIVNVSC